VAKVKIRLGEARQFERQLGILAKNYLTEMIARAIVLVERHKGHGNFVEALEFPTYDQVQRRWSRVKNKLNVKRVERWTPTNAPNFEAYSQRLVDRESEKKFIDDVFGLKYAAYRSAAAGAAYDLGRELWTNDATIQAIRQKTYKIVTTEITPNLRDDLIAKIEASINSGMSIEETAHELGLLNTNWRTVAKTETFDALNTGAWDQIHQEAEETGAEILKYWQHSGNSRDPRDAHVQAGEQYGPDNAIPVDQPFMVDGEAMQYPHDPNASAKNVVNCGCTCVYITRDAQGNESESADNPG
jgi:hypothetical protein